MWRAGRKSGRQTVVSTHSPELLSDESIDSEEVLILQPSKEGTDVTSAASHRQMRELLAGGLSMGDAVLPQTRAARSREAPSRLC
jgi:hypothetical protein